MRWALGLVLVALGCDSFADAPHDLRSTQAGVGGTQQGPTKDAGGTSFTPPVLIVDAPVVEPEPDRDWCTVAKQQGATFCEERTEPFGRVLEYCDPAPAAPPSAGGAAGMSGTAGMSAAAAGGDAAFAGAGAAGADTGAAGADTGAAGADTGAAGADTGAAGADTGAAGGPGTGQPSECVQYDRPPGWVYDLLIQCYAHCGVGIRMSQRRVEGSCCYLAQTEYYGR